MDSHSAIRRDGGFYKLPFSDTDGTVRWLAVTVAEPRETNRHAAANRLAGGEMAPGAHEQQRRLALLMEGRDVRAMQVNFRRAGLGGNNDFWQAAVAVYDRDAASDFVDPQLFDAGWHNSQQILARAEKQHSHFVRTNDLLFPPRSEKYLREVFTPIGVP